MANSEELEERKNRIRQESRQEPDAQAGPGQHLRLTLHHNTGLLADILTVYNRKFFILYLVSFSHNPWETAQVAVMRPVPIIRLRTINAL